MKTKRGPGPETVRVPLPGTFSTYSYTSAVLLCVCLRWNTLFARGCAFYAPHRAAFVQLWDKSKSTRNPFGRAPQIIWRKSIWKTAQFANTLSIQLGWVTTVGSWQTDQLIGKSCICAFSPFSSNHCIGTSSTLFPSSVNSAGYRKKVYSCTSSSALHPKHSHFLVYGYTTAAQKV